MRITTWELLGIVFIIIVGSLLHFVFELSGYSVMVAPIAAVNESVWEHLKLGFWPAVLFTLIEYAAFKNKNKGIENFFMAKTYGIYIIPVSIAALFYGYTAILGGNVRVLDILTFMVAVVLGQGVSLRLLQSQYSAKWNWIFIFVLILAVMFVVFTFYPPHIFLFQDSLTGGYGIVEHSIFS
ncbi:MAG: DUF6512 family protein [Candidatus Methanofastidiosia archaeon]|jgi:hypothetical protein